MLKKVSIFYLLVCDMSDQWIKYGYFEASVDTNFNGHQLLHFQKAFIINLIKKFTFN